MPHIEVTLRCWVLRPPKENIACRLHDALPLDHAPTLVTLISWRQPLEHGIARFLDLQEQRRAVAARIQGDRAERADTADPSHLERNVLERISIDEADPI